MGFVREGVDYAWSKPPPAALKAAGKTFVCRYLSRDPSKNLTARERRDLHKAGIDVVLNWETTAIRALAGFEGGVQDATEALRQANQLGAPETAAIYFSVDFDASERQQILVNEYLRGCAKVLGRDRVGVYGGYWVVNRALDIGICKWAWQTSAWSGGRWDPRAHIQQYAYPHEYDLDRAVKPQFGQWPAHPYQPGKRINWNRFPRWLSWPWRSW